MITTRRQSWLVCAGVSTALLFAMSRLDAQAQPRRAQPLPTAAVKATKVTTVEGITEYSLPNGLRVLLFPDQSKPTVTVNMTYLVGSRHEGYGESGMAHLLEHLIFKGTTKYPSLQKSLSEHGAQRNCTTWYDRTNCFEVLPSNDANLEFGLDLEADRMINSVVTKAALEPEFTVVRNELENRENSPTNVAFERMMTAAFRWHAYGRSVVGNKADLENVPVDRLQQFYKRYYQPDNAVLVIAGKFDPAKTLTLVENKLGRIPRPKRTIEAGNILYPTYTTEPTQDGERLTTIRRVSEAQFLIAGYHAPAAAHPDLAAVEVLQEALSSSPGGRLYKSLVETKLTTNIQGGTEPLREGSMMYFGGQLRADQSLDSARAALERTVDAARTSTFSAEEVDRVKTSLLKDIELTLNSSERVGLALADWVARGDWRLLFIYRDRLAKVTPADVQRVAAAYLKPSNRTIAYFIPTAQPDRAEIPPTPSNSAIAAMVADYKGREVVQAGEAFDASPKNIDARTKHSVLANGMQLTLLPKLTRGAKVVAQILLRFGNEQTLTGKGQVPSLTGGMLSRGTTALTRQQVQDSLDKLKAQVRLSASAGGATVVLETTRPNLIPTLEIVAQELRAPRFDAEEFDKLKKENLAGIEQAKSQPTVLGQIALNRKMSPRPKGHPQYVQTPDEIIAELNAATLDDLKAFHQGFYGASAADLVVLGDMDEAALKTAAAKLFGDWKNPGPYTRVPRPYARTDSSFESIETPDKANAFFIAGQTIELRDDDPDYPALLYGNFLLGGGLTSRLWERIRSKEGISYSVGSGIQALPLDRSGQWLANAIYAPQNIERLQRAFREELDRALKDGFTTEEVEKLKAGYLQTRTQPRSDDNQLLGILLARRFAGRTMAYDEKVDGAIQALTADQVNAALRKYIDPRQIIIVRAGDFAKNPPVKTTP